MRAAAWCRADVGTAALGCPRGEQPGSRWHEFRETRNVITMAPTRLSYEESCRRLCGDPRCSIPPMPDHRPGFDDPQPLGMNFYRTLIDETLNFTSLTLPRTFFGRSEIRKTSFQNADLRESSLRWNDFLDVDFTGAELTGSDMRSSNFERVKFAGTDLNSADMRRSWFRKCAFDGALMRGTILTRHQGSTLTLSPQQQAVIDWRDDDGPEPEGG
jgi:hypothetical protein